MSDSYVDSDMRNEDGDSDLCAGVRVVKSTYAGGKGTAQGVFNREEHVYIKYRLSVQKFLEGVGCIMKLEGRVG